jgi:hypothetical protein
MTRSELPRFGELVGVERVLHVVRLKKRERQQPIGGRRRERLVLLGRQRAQAMPGLRRDDDAGASATDDLPELFEHHRGTVQVDLEDRRGRRL